MATICESLPTRDAVQPVCCQRQQKAAHHRKWSARRVRDLREADAPLIVSPPEGGSLLRHPQYFPESPILAITTNKKDRCPAWC